MAYHTAEYGTVTAAQPETLDSIQIGKRLN